MKNIIRIIRIGIIGTVLSCGEDTNIQELRNNENILRFESHEDFENTINAISKMNKDELDVWEKNKSFVSFRTHLSNVYKELDAVTDQNMYDFLIEKSKSIITIKDSTLIPVISIPLYQAIANSEGLYETNGFVNKVYGDFILTTKKENLKIIIEYDPQTLVENWRRGGQKIKDITVNQISGFYDKSNGLNKTNATCTTQETASYFYNQSNCRNDREVVILAKSYIIFSQTFEGDWRQHRVLIEISALRRSGTFCNWYVYNTNITRKNFSFSILAWEYLNGINSLKRYDIVVPDYTTTTDTYYIPWDYAIGTRLLNQLISPQPFISLYGEATHRGVNGNWAVISSN